MENIRPFPTIQSFSDVIFAFFRAALGLLLLFRDIDFIFDMSHLQKLISSTGFTYDTQIIAYLISSIHLFGGALIILGLITRIAIILQIPIVLAAVLFNMMSTTYGSSPQLILSFTILVLLVFYLIKGPGKISMDHYRKLYKL